MDPSNRDAINSAIYNPKEFRRDDLQSEAGIAPKAPVRWWFLLDCLLIGGVGTMFILRSPAPSSLVNPKPGISAFSSGLGKPAPNLPLTGPGISLPIPSSKVVTRMVTLTPATPVAPFKLVGMRDGRHCLFWLATSRETAPVLSVFVRAGDAVETTMPLGQYRGSFSCGSSWYGKNLFGPYSEIRQAVAPLSFTRDKSGNFQGLVIELTPQLGGNLPTYKTGDSPFQF